MNTCAAPARRPSPTSRLSPKQIDHTRNRKAIAPASRASATLTGWLRCAM
jgi:hypothetical protein